MFNFMYKWQILIILLVLTSFLFFDEEPIYDMTDRNIIHIFLMICGIIVVIFDNIVKSKYGQLLFKDQTLLFSTFFHFLTFKNK